MADVCPLSVPALLTFSVLRHVIVYVASTALGGVVVVVSVFVLRIITRFFVGAHGLGLQCPNYFFLLHLLARTLPNSSPHRFDIASHFSTQTLEDRCRCTLDDACRNSRFCCHKLWCGPCHLRFLQRLFFVRCFHSRLPVKPPRR
jgi:hypothetical protein